jgi:lipopolysaccharide/colanic/teichoic acid biosynthesis glycosyltransferase
MDTVAGISGVMKHTLYQRVGKRTVDVLGAIFGLVVLAPVFLFIAVLVIAASRGPVFFRQTRVGQFGKLFRIFKFRSMTGSGSGRGALLTTARDPRVTPLGQWLRTSKLDELPQLINVLLGEMSLVGPRPEVPEYVATYSEDQRRVLLAKPGITGLVAMNNVQEEDLLAAQDDKDHFYQTVLLPAKLRVDLLYCEDVRLKEDLRILFGTFFKIFHRSDGTKSPLISSPEKQT